MQDFDQYIKKSKDILYYARYVDDIIVISTNSDGKSIRKILDEELKKIGLAKNRGKTRSYDILDNKQQQGSNQNLKPVVIEYLGYKYSITNKSITIDITNRKYKKYLDRLLWCFNEYTSNESFYKANLPQNSVEYSAHQKYNRILLAQRLQVLSSNLKIVAYNKVVYLGIYFSNPFLTLSTAKNFLKLDKKIIQSLKKHNLKDLLGTQTPFKDGFENKKVLVWDLRKKRKSPPNVGNKAQGLPSIKRIKAIKKMWKLP